MWTEILFFTAALPPPPPPPESVRGLAGAWAEFHGCVRAEEKGAKIAALRYDIYEVMARRVLTTHLEALEKKHGLIAARFWHRGGIVPVGEAAVYAAIAAPHRREAFAALAELMDRLKTDVPIWKAEVVPA
jgi:molybdopterin synthase catalytic subunit